MIRYAASVLRQPGLAAPGIAQPAAAPTAPSPAPVPVVEPTPNKMAVIADDVSYYMGVPLAEMYSDRRHREYARARQVAIWVVAKTTPFPLSVIGRHFRRDHTTVMHAIKKIDSLRVQIPYLSNISDALVTKHGGCL